MCVMLRKLYTGLIIYILTVFLRGINASKMFFTDSGY